MAGKRDLATAAARREVVSRPARAAPSRSRRHHLALAEGPAAYAMFQKKQDCCIKVVLRP